MKVLCSDVALKLALFSYEYVSLTESISSHILKVKILYVIGCMCLRSKAVCRCHMMML